VDSPLSARDGERQEIKSLELTSSEMQPKWPLSASEPSIGAWMQRLAETEAVLAIIRILFVLITPALDSFPGCHASIGFPIERDEAAF
jgi:hypothetical protein